MTPEEVLQRHLLLVDTTESQEQDSLTSTQGRQEVMTSSMEGTPAGRHSNSGEESSKSKDKRKLSVREIVSLTVFGHTNNYYVIVQLFYTGS